MRGTLFANSRVEAQMGGNVERVKTAMPLAAAVASRPKNRLLAALSADEFARIAPHLERVPIRVRQQLHRQGERIEDVYFPNGGVVSITTVLSNGATVEGATIGREGFVGIPAFFADAVVSPFESVVQVPDTDAMKLRVVEFRRELARSGTLRTMVEEYVPAMIAQMMQSNACNAVHGIQQRCARWLLLVRDHMGADEFHLSHEYLAQMLAVRRPTVSGVAAELRRDGVLEYRHGRVRILDGQRLAARSCECYAIVRSHFARLERHE
jgi:CRP-like cAMP-binding protein